MNRRSAGVAGPVLWNGWRFQPGCSLPLGESKQKVINQSWEFECKEASIGGRESLRAQGSESSLELVLLLGCLGLRLRGEPWVRPEQKMAWKACWAGPQADGIWDASVW